MFHPSLDAEASWHQLTVDLTLKTALLIILPQTSFVVIDKAYSINNGKHHAQQPEHFTSSSLRDGKYSYCLQDKNSRRRQRTLSTILATVHSLQTKRWTRRLTHGHPPWKNNSHWHLSRCWTSDKRPSLLLAGRTHSSWTQTLTQGSACGTDTAQP